MWFPLSLTLREHLKMGYNVFWSSRTKETGIYVQNIESSGNLIKCSIWAAPSQKTQILLVENENLSFRRDPNAAFLLKTISVVNQVSRIFFLILS